jgi:hypothetical protein
VGTKQHPDIYYIVLDRYSRADVLEEVYDCDITGFLEYLTNKGFFVASNSYSNYLKTAHSLASSLNMKHILHLTSMVGEDSDNWGPLYKMVQDHEVGRFLKGRGYKFIHLGSWWKPTAQNKLADRNISLSALPEFSSIVYRTTMLRPVLTYLKIYDSRSIQWKRVLYKFDQLAGMPSIKGPTFVFAHMLIPHPPYVFDRDGNFVPTAVAGKKSKKLKYKEQLDFTNRKLTLLIDGILSESSTPPIIILQADEGEYPERYQANIKSFDWRNATPAELRQKLGILNAFYLPGFPEEKLYPSITPVNTFRFIFNHYFDRNLEPLPDNCYAFVDENHIYKFFDVTEELNKR